MGPRGHLCQGGNQRGGGGEMSGRAPNLSLSVILYLQNFV